jgi:LAO/AO transport system kinase
LDLAKRVLEGDRRAVARLISLIEDEAPGVEDELRSLYPHTGRAHVIGVTGAPGSGKSTLARGLTGELRRQGRKVGIIAVDPTSPFTGGAVLGDRVRMQDLTGDPGVFIRSMASRGALGGLARATADAARVLDAFGCDAVLIETVGTGQAEVDIARTAHSTVVVLVPGMGDEVQAIKAGVLEIADLFVVNKADRADAGRVVSELTLLLRSNLHPGAWVPPILKTVATAGTGVPEVVGALDRHREYLRESGELDRRLRENALRELVEAVRQQLLADLWRGLDERELDVTLASIVERHLDARSAARELVKRWKR